MGKRQSQESMLSASSNSSWCLVDNKSALPANNYPSSSAPGRIVREQSSFYQVRADSVVQSPTGNPTRKRRLAPGRIMCISERQCASASRSNSTASRRERSHTDTVINQAWRKYLEFDDESARDSAQCIATSDDSAENASQPLPELWMWRQAAIAVRNRRSKSLSAQQQQQLYQKQKPL
ncbi:hypothetical protein LPJ59_002867 [Coemansia sp. RSA 2399]|nr:hypothetical protein LPJ59_002867 [Coemansia sp. RSA 2399]